MIITTKKLGSDEDFWIVSGKERIACCSKGAFSDNYYFYPEEKYKEKLKGIVVNSSSSYDLIYQTARVLGAIYVNGHDGDYTIQYSPKPIGWVVCVGKLELIKWVPYNHHAIPVTNKGALHMHATKFLKRATARKVASLCDGQVFSWPYLFPIIEEKLKSQEIMRKNLQRMADDFHKDENTFDYDLVKLNFELLGEEVIWQGLYFLHQRYKELSAEPSLAI